MQEKSQNRHAGCMDKTDTLNTNQIKQQYLPKRQFKGKKLTMKNYIRTQLLKSKNPLLSSSFHKHAYYLPFHENSLILQRIQQERVQRYQQSELKTPPTTATRQRIKVSIKDQQSYKNSHNTSVEQSQMNWLKIQEAGDVGLQFHRPSRTKNRKSTKKNIVYKKPISKAVVPTQQKPICNPQVEYFSPNLEGWLNEYLNMLLIKKQQEKAENIKKAYKEIENIHQPNERHIPAIPGIYYRSMKQAERKKRKIKGNQMSMNLEQYQSATIDPQNNNYDRELKSRILKALEQPERLPSNCSSYKSNYEKNKHKSNLPLNRPFIWLRNEVGSII